MGAQPPRPRHPGGPGRVLVEALDAPPGGAVVLALEQARLGDAGPPGALAVPGQHGPDLVEAPPALGGPRGAVLDLRPPVEVGAALERRAPDPAGGGEDPLAAPGSSAGGDLPALEKRPLDGPGGARARVTPQQEGTLLGARDQQCSQRSASSCQRLRCGSAAPGRVNGSDPVRAGWRDARAWARAPAPPAGAGRRPRASARGRPGSASGRRRPRCRGPRRPPPRPTRRPR